MKRRIGIIPLILVALLFLCCLSSVTATILFYEWVRCSKTVIVENLSGDEVIYEVEIMSDLDVKSKKSSPMFLADNETGSICYNGIFEYETGVYYTRLRSEEYVKEHFIGSGEKENNRYVIR